MAIAKKRININMLTKKIWLLIGAFAILSAGVVGVNAYLSKKAASVVENHEKELLEESTSTEPEVISSTSEIDTSDWNIYQDKKLRISFKYPKEWHLESVIELAKNGGWTGSYDYPGLNVWLNFVEKQFYSGYKQEQLEDFCEETLPFPFVGGADHLLNCQKIVFNANKSGIIRDSFVCPTAACPPGGPCGGEPTIDHCEYLRIFILDLDNNEYPRFVAGIKWGQQTYEDKCSKFKESLPIEKLYSCMIREYEYCKNKKLNELQRFNKFIKGVQTW